MALIGDHNRYCICRLDHHDGYDRHCLCTCHHHHHCTTMSSTLLQLDSPKTHTTFSRRCGKTTHHHYGGHQSYKILCCYGSCSSCRSAKGVCLCCTRSGCCYPYHPCQTYNLLYPAMSELEQDVSNPGLEEVVQVS